MSSSSSSRRRRKKPPSPLEPAPGEARDWAGLARDILVDIFLRLGPCREIMRGAERACTAWRRVAVEEPMLWRRIDFPAVPQRSPRRRAMARAAVDRSGGQCEAFYGPVDQNFLVYLVERAPFLKSLHLILSANCVVKNEILSTALKKLTVLEDLEISTSYCSQNLFKSVCQACPLLEKLGVKLPDITEYYDSDQMEFSDGGLSEIPNMCKLRSLELFEFELTTDGLTAILDNCPLLESLHITGSFVEIGEMDKELQAKCARVKNLILPDDEDENDWYGGALWLGTVLG